MANPEEIEEELPLDPATERVRKKMARLLVVSISIMMIGLMAVLGAIVYKVMDEGEAEAVQYEAGTAAPYKEEYLARVLDLPPAARIKTVSLDGLRVLIHLELDQENDRLVVYDISKDAMVAQISLR